MGQENKAHCARAEVWADKASGVTRGDVKVATEISLNSTVRGVPSGWAKAAAQASQMSAAVARSSSGASSWSIAD